MVLRSENTQRTLTDIEDPVPNRANETSVYITDLLGELETIARIGGLISLSDDIELVLAKHISGQSIL